MSMGDWEPQPYITVLSHLVDRVRRVDLIQHLLQGL